MKKIIGYKVLTKEMKSPYDKKTSWKLGEVTELENDEPLEIAENGLHLYKSLDNITIGKFGERVFKAEIIGEYIEDKNKYVARKVKLLEEIDPSEVGDSEWCYHYCLNVENDINVAKNITDSYWAYCYCKDIKDIKEIRDRITDSRYAYCYCLDIKDIEEIRDRITDSYYAYRYCLDIKNRKKIAKRITDPYWKNKYEIWKKN